MNSSIKAAVLVTAVLLTGRSLFSAENLKINPHLDYSSDSVDGPLITGSDISAGFVAGKPNYVMIYGEGCFNSKRQARRTVALYDKYKGKVNFVVIDLDQPHPQVQQTLIDRYYKNLIPDLIILDSGGKPLYDQAGEQDESVLSGILDKALEQEPGSLLEKPK